MNKGYVRKPPSDVGLDEEFHGKRIGIIENEFGEAGSAGWKDGRMEGRKDGRTVAPEFRAEGSCNDSTQATCMHAVLLLMYIIYIYIYMYNIYIYI